MVSDEAMGEGKEGDLFLPCCLVFKFGSVDELGFGGRIPKWSWVDFLFKVAEV